MGLRVLVQASAATGVLASLLGCATPYVAPTGTGSVAVTIRNQGPAAAVFIRSSQVECSTTSGAGFLGIVGVVKLDLGAERLERTTQVTSGSPVTISMGWWDTGPVRECGEKVTFTPRAGSEYEIEYTSTYVGWVRLADVTACDVVIRQRQAGSKDAYISVVESVIRTREDICIR